MINNLSAFFVRRPVATTLLSIGVTVAGIFAFSKLPVSPLPQVDFPTISVQAKQPGASPEEMASSVAAPLEKHLSTIADITEMTSSSAFQSTIITLQFGLGRDINGAARDVEAAIQASRADLPASLPSNPSYHKVDLTDGLILVLSLTSSTRSQGQLFDLASNLLKQRLSQIENIGQVTVQGSSLPSVRVELNPTALNHYGIGLETIRAALANANASSAKGEINGDNTSYSIDTNDRASRASQYRDLVIAYRNDSAVYLSNVGEVIDSVENLRAVGLTNGRLGVVVSLYRQPGANIIKAVDTVRAQLPQLIASLPADINVKVVVDRSPTIRASLVDAEKALTISVTLVMLVVFLFLRNVRAAAIAGIGVPISITATFGIMYLLGYSLNILSLMALTISTSFVVDDAVVVEENIARLIDEGAPRMQASLVGSREIGFTVLSITISLVAVFLPILLMPSIIGKLFREFAVTLSAAVLISMMISLTLTPMICSRFLPGRASYSNGWFHRVTEGGFNAMLDFYRLSLTVALRHPLVVIFLLLSAIGLNFYLLTDLKYGLFPNEDTGLLVGEIQADQNVSTQSMKEKMTELLSVVQADPAVTDVGGYSEGGNKAFVFVTLKPLAERHTSADLVMARLRPALSNIPGAHLYLQPVADLRSGARQAKAAYQYTLQADDVGNLYHWGPLLVAQLKKSNAITDVSSDQQQGGHEVNIDLDRSAIMRLGLSMSAVSNTLYDAFGQRQVSTIYGLFNQYHVVMELSPRFWQDPRSLEDIWISTSANSPSGTSITNANSASYITPSTIVASGNMTSSATNQATNSVGTTGYATAPASSAVSTKLETMVPLNAVARYSKGLTPLVVNHDGPFVATTISFNLAPGHSLSEAKTAIASAINNIRLPRTVHGSFTGTAAIYEQALLYEFLLVAAALGAIYIVLGILYESYIHPLTILSTLPSASLGALLAMKLFHTEFTIISMIGIILLIGIVKKNAIMMIDFALQAERGGLSTRDAIFNACMLRFRPIMMTTFAALLGAAPLAFGAGVGAELRQPLGIAIIGGLIVSQTLTLYTTPILYLYFDRFARLSSRMSRRNRVA